MSDCEYEIDDDANVMSNNGSKADEEEFDQQNQKDQSQQSSSSSSSSSSSNSSDSSDSSDEEAAVAAPQPQPGGDVEESDESDLEPPPHSPLTPENLLEMRQEEEGDDEEELGELQMDDEQNIASSNVSMMGDGEFDQMMDEDDDGQLDEGQSSSSNRGPLHYDGYNGGDEDEVVIEPDMLNEHGVYKWPEFEGAIIRQYTPDQYRALQLPFQIGWKRELVIRTNTSTAEKKAGDVYYYPPGGHTKLRSYVELNGWLKDNTACKLTKENFTYAKQPVWRPPDEIVRAALARGCNYVQRPEYFQRATAGVYKTNRGARGGTNVVNIGRGGFAPSASKGRGGGGGSPSKKSTSAHIDSNDSSLASPNSGHQMYMPSSATSVGFGRGKRKRVLPSRYDEDNYSLIPTVKKTKGGGGGNGFRDSMSNGNSQDSVGSPASSSASRDRTEQPQQQSQHHQPQQSTHQQQSHHHVTAGHRMSATKLERRLNLQKQLLQQVHEDNMKKQKLYEEQQAAKAAAQGDNIKQESVPAIKIKIPKGSFAQIQQQAKQSQRFKSENGGIGSQVHTQFDDLILDSSLGGGGGQSILDTSNENDEFKEPAQHNQRQPCSAHCSGQRNRLPNLMCARCFCLFHIDCVKDGVWLNEPTVFICPNCCTAEDRANASGQSLPKQKKKLKSMNGSNGVYGGDAMDLSFHQDYNGTPLAPSNRIMNASSHMQHDSIPTFTKSSSSLLKSSNGSGLASAYGHGYMNGGGSGGFGKKLKSRGGGGASSTIVPGMSQSQQQQKKLEQQIMFMNGSNGGGGQYPKLSSALAPASMGRGFGGPSKRGGKHGSYGSYGIMSGLKPSSSSHSTMSSLQPSINHVYRLANTTNGHQIILKDKTMPPHGSRYQNSLLNSSSTPVSSSSATTLAQKYARNQYYSTLNSSTAPSSTKMSDIETKFTPRPSHSLPMSSRFAKYLQRSTSVLNNFSSSLSALLKILDYLDTRDIVSLRQTSRFWHQLTTMSPIWMRLKFRNLTIVDWTHLSSKIIGANMVTLLDFEGVRLPQNPQSIMSNGQQPNDSIGSSPCSTTTTSGVTSPQKLTSRQEKIASFWRNFSLLHHHMGSVQALKFGTVPLCVLRELVAYAQEQSIDPLASLRHLSVLNLFDETKSQNNPDSPICLMDLFPILAAFRAVSSLRLESKNGFLLQSSFSPDDKPTREELLQTIIGTLTQFKHLEQLALTGINDLSADEFGTLLTQSLPHERLKRLELGSCANWFDAAQLDPYEEIAKCRNLIELRLVDVILGQAAGSLVSLFESLILVERLTLDNLRVEDEGYQAWSSLTAIFKSLPLATLHISTSDPFTNRAVFESARDLVCTQKRSLRLSWIVTVNVDDAGHCYVPVSRLTFSTSPNSGVDFVKRYLTTTALDQSQQSPPQQDAYQIVDGEQWVLVEISTLSDLLNRDINLNALAATSEPRVQIQIIPQ